MQAVSMLHEHIIQAVSDDGRIAVLETPTTRLYGEFRLRDNETGQEMYRGEYLGADGKCCGQRVPADVWAAAVDLMQEINKLNGAAEDAKAARARSHQEARDTALSERLATDMDRPDSDL